VTVSVSLPNPSSRLVRAAAAERAAVTRHRARLIEQREDLIRQLRGMDDALAAVDERLAVLGQLAEAPDRAVRAVSSRHATSRIDERDADAPRHIPASRDNLRGPAIREVAVQVLLAEPSLIEAIHYRRWYELVTDAGYAVVGKDPLAVFLTQVTRSPLVRKAAQPGVYEIDRQAPLRIRQRLEKLQLELREVTLDAASPTDLAAVRARRHELDVAISQLERALEEAVRVLDATPDRSSSLSPTAYAITRSA
jgi:hypothetical protein